MAEGQASFSSRSAYRTDVQNTTPTWTTITQLESLGGMWPSDNNINHHYAMEFDGTRGVLVWSDLTPTEPAHFRRWTIGGSFEASEQDVDGSPGGNYGHLIIARRSPIDTDEILFAIVNDDVDIITVWWDGSADGFYTSGNKAWTEQASGISTAVEDSFRAVEFQFCNAADATAPTITARTTRDNDGDGQIDRIELTFSENIDDSTANTAHFSVDGYTISGIDTGGTADDEQLFLTLTESGSADSDATPDVTYTQGTLADLATNLLDSDGGATPADGAAPVIVSAASTMGSTTLTVTFSEPVDTSNAGAGDLVSGDFSYSDVSSGGAGSISSMGADADGTDEVVTLTVNAAFNAGDHATDTLAAAASQIYDLADNAAGTTAVALAIGGIDSTPPTITARTTRDNDGDGKIDRIELTFDEYIDDSTANTAHFSVDGYTISGIDTGSTADDDQLFLTLTEGGAADSDATPDVTYTQGTLADLAATPNLLASDGGVAPADGASPVILSATAPEDGTTLTVTFSEPVDTSNSGAGNLVTGDFTYSDVSGGDAGAISSMGADADGTDEVVTITVDAAFNDDDNGTDTIAAASAQIYDLADNAAGTTAVALTLTGAVNDAPVHSVPDAQETPENTALVFSSGAANLISISDSDAGANDIQVTLTGTNGTITLNGTTGLDFTDGDGTADAAMTFTGTLSEINTSLNGLSFDPTTDFTGTASLRIQTNDQGFTGSGGNQTDDDTVDITVATAATAAVSGTITPSTAETAIVTGGKTIIIDLTDDTWVPDDGSFNDLVRQEIIDGITSAMSESTGWNNEVRDKQSATSTEVVRTSDTRVTITLDAQAVYAITAAEVITVTVPAEALVTSTQAVVGAPVIVVTNSTSTVTAYQVENADASGASDPTCADKVNPYTSAPTVELIVDPETTCADEDKVKFTTATTTPQTMLNTYFKDDGSGYDNDTLVEVQNSGNSITFKSKNVAGDYKIELWEVDPSDGSFDTLKDSETKAYSPAGDTVTWTDFSALSATIAENMTFGFKFIFTAEDTTSSDHELKFGEYGVDGTQQKFYISETPQAGTIAAVSGSVATAGDEIEVVNGGGTIFIDLINDTWVAAGATFDAQRQAIINGLDSAQSETNGWNAEVRDKQGVAGVERTSDTRVTITLDAQENYFITADETITVTVPAAALTGAVAITGTPTFAVNNLCPFTYRRALTIDYTKVGADNSGTLPATGFPVLVSLSGDWLKTTTADPVNGRIESTTGDDILFRASGIGPHHYHEIEDYDGTAGTLTAWVRIDSLSKAADTVLYVYYGNDCVDYAIESSTNVWDDDFLSVWHLDEAVSDEDTHADSTGNSRTGTRQDNDASGGGDATGRIDGADEFDGTDDYVDFSAHISDFASLTTGTVSAWAKRDNTGNRDIIFAFNETSSSDRFVLEFQDTGVARVVIRDNDLNSVSVSGGSVGDTSWHHIAVTNDDASEVKLYVDGEDVTPVSPEANANDWFDAVAGKDFMSIGYDDRAQEKRMDGFVDEVRISGSARDADWIKTSFNNQSDTTIGAGYFFKSLGNEEVSPVTSVELVSFTAVGEGTGVNVAWETARESHHAGFHLYRSTSADGTFVRLTAAMIPGAGFSIGPQTYGFVDNDITPGEIYYYLLEDIDVSGLRTDHGPICVDWDADGLPDDWEIAHGLDPGFDDAALDSDNDGLSNLQEYARGTDPHNPDSDGDGVLDGLDDGRIERSEAEQIRSLDRGVYVVASDDDGITIELRTEFLDSRVVKAGGERFDRLQIGDYVHGYTETVGAPQMPLKGVLVDIPLDSPAGLAIVETELETRSGYRVYPVPENVGHESGEQVAEVFVIDDGAYAADAFYPGAAARLGDTFVFRDQAKQQVVFHPVVYNPATGRSWSTAASACASTTATAPWPQRIS